MSEREELIKRLQAYIEREWLTRKQTGLTQGLAMIPPAGEIEQLLTDCLSALTAQQSQQEPVAFMWQHEETGAKGFVENASKEDLAQWERMNKPRKIICSLYAAPPSGVRAGMLNLMDESGKFFDWGNKAGDALREMMAAYERRVRTLCTSEEIEKQPWRCAEYLIAEQMLADKPNWFIDITRAADQVNAEGRESDKAATDEYLRKVNQGYVFKPRG